ncbi:hypothetical protein Tco_0359708 [Tanacetum coccineum]
MFSLPKCLKPDNTVRVNQIVTIFLIESSIPLLDQNRYPVDTSLIHIESRKSPIIELFDVDPGRISIITVNTKEYHSDVLIGILLSESHNPLVVFASRRLGHNKRIETHIMLPQLTTQYSLASSRTGPSAFRLRIEFHRISIYLEDDSAESIEGIANGFTKVFPSSIAFGTLSATASACEGEFVGVDAVSVVVIDVVGV